MELTFLNDLGQSFVVEIDPNMELENVMALLEVEVSCWIRSKFRDSLFIFSLVSL